MDIVPNRMMRHHKARRRGNIALGLAITVILGSATGVLVARGEAPAAASNALEPIGSSMPEIDWRSAPVPTVSPKAEANKSPQVSRKSCGPRSARVLTFRVSVEKGLDTTRAKFARQVRRVLCDERSWISSGRVRFRYDPRGSMLIGLRSAYQTEVRCLRLIGLSVRLKWSCASRGAREAVINADRWFDGSPTWDGSVARYRHMVVNHEVGHLLGQRHRGCSGRGEPAPVMMQQSKGTGGCRVNPWPLAWEARSLPEAAVRRVRTRK